MQGRNTGVVTSSEGKTKASKIQAIAVLFWWRNYCVKLVVPLELQSFSYLSQRKMVNGRAVFLIFTVNIK